jgi:hypothetical protein
VLNLKPSNVSTHKKPTFFAHVVEFVALVEMRSKPSFFSFFYPNNSFISSLFLPYYMMKKFNGISEHVRYYADSIEMNASVLGTTSDVVVYNRCLDTIEKRIQQIRELN